jgi:hypothetical protein
MVCIDEDDKWPIFETNGNIKIYCTLYDSNGDENDDKGAKIFKRDGLKLTLLREDVIKSDI